jgi:ABC-2 type transport system permease protein/sodium transport system permease protein
MHELVVLQQGFGESLVNPALLEQASQLLRELKRVPFPLVLLSIAIAPAVFEELLFRGLLLQALLPRMSPARAILASALAFGAFHILLFGNLTLAKILPTTCMGLVLGFVCYRSGSVLPGMLLHACYNGMAVGIMYHIEWLNVESWGIEAQPHLPWHWLLFAALGTLAGFAALWFARRR